MKKIETWEDLKEVFKDNKDISFKIISTDDGKYSFGECIILKDIIAFDKKGNMLGTFDKTYDEIELKEQQIYDFIKKRLE